MKFQSVVGNLPSWDPQHGWTHHCTNTCFWQVAPVTVVVPSKLWSPYACVQKQIQFLYIWKGFRSKWISFKSLHVSGRRSSPHSHTKHSVVETQKIIYSSPFKMWWFWVSSTPTVCLAGNYSSSYPPPRGSLAVLSAHSQCFQWHLQWCYLPMIHLNLVWKNQIKQFDLMGCDFIGDLVFHFVCQFDEVLLLVNWCFNVDLVLILCFFHVLVIPDAPWPGPFVTNSCHPVKHWGEE